MAPVRLSAGDLELVLDPDRGGSIMALRVRSFDLLRPCWDPEQPDPRRFACFPLVPFSGRIDRGRFVHAGRTHAVPLNFAPEPHAIHGDGWTSPWALVSAGPSAAELELLHDRPEAVWRYRAWQRFWLYPDRLEVELGVTNRGPAAMPFGLGLHPYLTHREDALLSAEVAGVWLPDDANIPRRLEPVPVLWRFDAARPVEELVLDHNFQGWSGTARIDWPEHGRSLTIAADPPLRHLVVYVPPGMDFFCVEPVSQVADGFNLLADGVADTGVQILGPGETLKGAVRFIPGKSGGTDF